MPAPAREFGNPGKAGKFSQVGTFGRRYNKTDRAFRDEGPQSFQGFLARVGFDSLPLRAFRLPDQSGERHGWAPQVPEAHDAADRAPAADGPEQRLPVCGRIRESGLGTFEILHYHTSDPGLPFFSQEVEDTMYFEERYGRVPVLEPVERKCSAVLHGSADS